VFDFHSLSRYIFVVGFAFLVGQMLCVFGMAKGVLRIRVLMLNPSVAAVRTASVAL
jgi:hypothetical protein